VFALPILLGLRLVGHLKAPRDEWRFLDTLRATERARPFLTEEVIGRLDGLRQVWGATSRAKLVRWLIVAAYRASLRGFRSEPRYKASAEHIDIAHTQAHKTLVTGDYVDVQVGLGLMH
jgi:hypothetical protein